MKTLKMIIEGFKNFGVGVQEGISQWQTLTKLPRWVCWIIGLLMIPFNLVLITGILIFGGWRKVCEIVELGTDYIKEKA